jgi:hypothetical protein
MDVTVTTRRVAQHTRNALRHKGGEEVAAEWPRENPSGGEPARGAGTSGTDHKPPVRQIHVRHGSSPLPIAPLAVLDVREQRQRTNCTEDKPRIRRSIR